MTSERDGMPPKKAKTSYRAAARALGYLSKGKAFKPLPQKGSKAHAAILRKMSI